MNGRSLFRKIAGTMEGPGGGRGRAGAFIAAAIVAVALTGIAPAPASAWTCAAPTGVQPPNPDPSFNELNGVAVLSSCDAWAVGSYDSGTVRQTFALHCY